MYKAKVISKKASVFVFARHALSQVCKCILGPGSLVCKKGFTALLSIEV